MSRKELFLLQLMFLAATAAEWKVGPNMTFFVRTLYQTVNSAEMPQEQAENVMQAVQNLTTEMKMVDEMTNAQLGKLKKTLDQLHSNNEDIASTLERRCSLKDVLHRENISAALRNIVDKQDQLRDGNEDLKVQLLEHFSQDPNVTRQELQDILKTLRELLKDRESLKVPPAGYPSVTEVGHQNKTVETLGDIVIKLTELADDVKFLKSWHHVPEKNKTESVCGDRGLYYSDGSGHCGSCFSYDFILRTWQEARDNCKRHGRDLVSIETAGENQFLMEIIQRHNSTILPVIRSRSSYFGFWTSGSDQDKEGTWIWKATGAPIGYKNWLQDQPSNAGHAEHVLEIMADGGKWNDERETTYMYAFCEKVLQC